MSSPRSPSTSTIPPESAEMAAERDRLIPELLKQAKVTTGATQTVLRKLADVLQQTRPGSPVNVQVYADAKAAFELFGKEPGLVPPPITTQVIAFLQKSAAAMGATGSTKPPASSPPAPAATGSGSIPPRSAPLPRRNTQDGFEMPKRTQSSVELNPAAMRSSSKLEPEVGTPSQPPKSPGIVKVKG